MSWSSRWRQYRSHLLAGVALCVFVVLGYGLFTIPSTMEVVVSRESNLHGSTTPPIIPVGPFLPAAPPVELRIPSLGLSVPFGASLGLAADGSVEVPEGYEEVGWYQHGPTPGELGPAVVLGHVDSESGPAVFYSLGQLVVGDTIEVVREDGEIATFAVTALERPRQDAFPTVSVYGDIDHAGLRLITCSGRFVRGEQRYTHNLIVYARLLEGTSNTAGDW